MVDRRLVLVEVWNAVEVLPVTNSSRSLNVEVDLFLDSGCVPKFIDDHV